MAVISLLCVLVPPFVAIVLVALPAVIDLVMREEQVPPWWAAPFAMFVPVVLMTLAAPVWMEPGIEQVGVTMIAWGMLHLAAAGLLLALATGLAFARGLRPGGETERRRRTSLVAIGALLFLMVLPWLPRLGATWWVVPPAWAGLFWVIGLNRRGPQRLERGKSIAASMLFASAISFLIAAAHLVRGVDLVDGTELVSAPAWIVSLLALGLLGGGLRFLAGPPAPAPLLAAAGSGLSLVFPAVWWMAFDPVPSDIEVPAWVGFDGKPGPTASGYGTHRCLTVVGRDGAVRKEGPRCPSGWNEASLVDARTPLDQVPVEEDYTAYLVGSGVQKTNTWRRYATPVYAEPREGGRIALLPPPMSVYSPDGTRPPPPEPLAVVERGPALAEAVRKHTGTDRPLHVTRTSGLTMQDFVSLCASMSEPSHCQLVRN